MSWFIHPARLRRTVWVALLTLLAALSAPTLSHALASSGSTVWVEVCTAQGMRFVPVSDSAETQQGQPLSRNGVMDHCSYCTFSIDTPALLSASMGAVVPSPLQALPERFLTAPRTAFVWSSAQPRGPPTFL